MPDTFPTRAVDRSASPSLPPEIRGELELRAGIEPLERLLNERRGFVNQVADLRAKYGSFGTFEHLRKIELSRIKGRIRLEAMRDKEKLNNDQVDERAHGDADYVEFVIEASRARSQYFRLEAEIESIDFRINRGQSLARFAAAEVGMTR